MTERKFRSKQPLLRYVGVNSRPGVYTPIQATAPRNKRITRVQVTSLRKGIEHIKKSPTEGLDFVIIHMKSTRVAVLADTLFENA